MVVDNSKVESFSTHIHELEGTLVWKKGWDGYDADPPLASTISRVKAFLWDVLDSAYTIDWMSPTNDHSVMVVLVNGLKKQEWDFYDDGDIAVTLDLGGGHKEFLDVVSEQVGAILNK